MLSAVSAQGKLRFMVHDGKVNSGVFIDFCKRLLRDADTPVYLVVDGHPCHRSRATKEFVAATEGRLKLFFLPGYSPELNPDEWVWKNVKHDRIAKTGVTSKDDLKTKATTALRRLQKLPHLVRAFFQDPNLAYITAYSILTASQSPWRMAVPLPARLSNSHRNGGSAFLIFVADPRTVRLFRNSLATTTARPEGAGPLRS